MRILVLGGTVFLSRRIAEVSVERGHDVTCLTRTAKGLTEGVRSVVADRSSGLVAYEDLVGEWDAVIDVATEPHFVRDALSVLAQKTRHWTFVSSCSVYADQDQPDADETSDILAPLADDEVSTPENYGAAKAAGEQWCREFRGESLLIVRPGLIVGRGDPSDRGGYWPMRFVRDHETVVVPEALTLRTQVIDVRDIAQWLVTCAEVGLTGTFNAVGDSRPLRDVLEEIRDAAGHHGDVVVVADQWLLDHGVSPWAGKESLPLWIPLGMGFDGFSRRSNAAARRSDLRLRPLDESVRDIIAYERDRGVDRERVAGLSKTFENELLEQFFASLI
jgi:nucleoside-diphosphate-sugar epimerase